jgi:hypothetical protein
MYEGGGWRHLHPGEEGSIGGAFHTQRLPPRLAWLQPRLAHQPLRLHLDMEAELLVQARFGSAPCEQQGAGVSGSLLASS